MFIVFEGIDGCGKSTQLWKLAKYISELNKYNHVLVTREPYKSREIREILKLDEKPEEKAEKLAELFVKDRKEHIEKIITPALKENIFVLCDRYKYSTIAYQASQGIDIKKLIEMHKEMPAPDLVFIFDLSVEVAMERMKKDSMRKNEQKFEKDINFLEKVRKNYLEIKKIFPNENIFIINAEKNIDEIFENLKNIFAEHGNL